MDPQTAADNDLSAEKEPAPLFGRWRNAYIAVAVVFIIDVALFYALGRSFV